MRYFTLILLLVLVTSACSVEEEIEQELQLMKLVDKFGKEGAKRGHVMSHAISAINIEFGNIAGDNLLGECRRQGSGRHKVIIDRTFWNKSNPLERECIVFHELGHCVLNREHLDDRDDNGECLSIMQSGQNLCIKSYTFEKRRHFLDELFQ